MKKLFDVGMYYTKYCDSNLNESDYYSQFKEDGVSLSPQVAFRAKYSGLDKNPADTNTSFVSHHIWNFGDVGKKISDLNLRIFNNKVLELDSQNKGWEHFFWTDSPQRLKEEIGRSPDTIIIRDIRTLMSDNENSIVSLLLEKGFVGVVKEIVLFSALNKYGGYYSDINFVQFRNPSDIIKNFDFFIQTSPYFSSSLFPSMIISIKAHPIIEETLVKVLENSLEFLSHVTVEECDKFFSTMVISFVPLMVSFYKNANLATRDIAVNSLYPITKVTLESDIAAIIEKEYDLSSDICEQGSEQLELFYRGFESKEVCTASLVIGLDLSESSWLV